MVRTSPCPFLIVELKSKCRAGSQAYEPSSFEREEYCRTVRHGICPFYCVATGRRYPAGEQIAVLQGGGDL
jgi:hypothetical protein